MAKIVKKKKNGYVESLDEVTETNQRDSYQKNAPQIIDGLYVVPRVVE